MCGRYTLTSVDGLIEEFSLIQESVQFDPRFNIAPSERVPVVDNRPKRDRVLVGMTWGLVPYWAKDPGIGQKLLNARCETVAEKPSFRQAFGRRRCLVVADGFYEWRRRGTRKVPFYFRRERGGFIAMAGVWERWRRPSGDWLTTFAVITTHANSLMTPIHDRMPVVVPREHYERWLSPEELGIRELGDMLVPPSVDGFEAFEVSPLVNRVQNDSPACIRPGPIQGTLL